MLFKEKLEKWLWSLVQWISPLGRSEILLRYSCSVRYPLAVKDLPEDCSEGKNGERYNYGRQYTGPPEAT